MRELLKVTLVAVALAGCASASVGTVVLAPDGRVTAKTASVSASPAGIETRSSTVEALPVPPPGDIR